MPTSKQKHALREAAKARAAASRQNTGKPAAPAPGLGTGAVGPPAQHPLFDANLSVEGENAVMIIDVAKQYGSGESAVHALRGVTLTIKRGQYVSIMGPSGSGKTTLFNAIGGLSRPTRGQVFIDEVDIAQLDPFELAWLRCRKIGYIFQYYNIVPVMTALENVMLPMIFGGVDVEEAQDRAVAILTRVGLGDRVTHTPMECSGGQQQRIAIARAFANQPALILADEPTANLDVNTGHAIIELLREMNRESGVTVITATHDHKMLDVSERIITVRDGSVEKDQLRSEFEIRTGSIRQ